jgi:hypothetical protein
MSLYHEGVGHGMDLPFLNLYVIPAVFITNHAPHRILPRWCKGM